MRIIKTKDYDQMSRVAGDIMGAQVRLKPRSVLGLATGSTPIGLYKELVRKHREEYLDFSQIISFNLDEYVGLSSEDPQSYRYFMDKHLLKDINIAYENTHLMSGVADDLEAEAANYDRMIDAQGGIDMQLLGMGNNGHIGFNEPEEHFIGPSHLVNLSSSTIDANARFFAGPGEVPKQAVTLGFRQIMQAKKVLLIVSGRAKADVLRKALEGSVHPRVPASILQLHRDLTVVGDEEALYWYKG